MTAPNDTTLLLTVEEAATTLRIGRSTVYELMRAGEIATVRIGRSRRVVAESLTAYLGRLRTTVD